MRERLSLDQYWRFALGHAANASLDFEFAASRDLVKAGEARGAAGVKFDDSKWQTVNVPHDWALSIPYDPAGDKELCDHGFKAVGPAHPESSVGWYRRQFSIPAERLGQRLSIEFDGVFRDSIVWVNGHRMGRHESGYTGFSYDITDIVNYGGTNTIAVRVNVTDYEGWWYDGAGIYRHVWFVATDPIHLERWSTFVTSELDRKAAIVSVQTVLTNDSDDVSDVRFTVQILNAAGKVVGSADQPAVQLAAWSKRNVKAAIKIDQPILWSCEQPNLYTARIVLSDGKAPRDQQDTSFGVRTLRWDAATGFYLNDQPLKIKGTCNHQNHAGVGVAIPDALHEFRVRKLKEMGSNAYRCSHYAATPELLDLCDRLGMLVMAENRLAGSTWQVLSDLEAMIRRDRNHPSIILWSLANEEHTVQWSIAGERIGKTMARLIHSLDPTRKVTAAMHDRGLGEGFANIVDVHGWNYINVGDIAAFHDRRPEQPIVGSEEGSTVCTRGVYVDDATRAYVSAYDIRSPKWGTTAEKWWTFFSDRAWLAGGFVWTGFDYRGEPIPYKWPNIGSHFGLMDSCGFPKDNYYYYRAWWTNDPVLHLFPHWNWPGREGQEIDVRCFTNCEQVELFLDGQSQGKREVRRNSHTAWKVIYQPGRLEAVGSNGGKIITQQVIETTGAAKRIVLAADRTTAKANGEDVVVVSVSVVDAAGRAVPAADNLVQFDVSGQGQLIGVGNGDPSSHESDKASFRRLFNGLAMAIVQTGVQVGSIRIVARSAGLVEATLVIQTEAAALRPAIV